MASLKLELNLPPPPSILTIEEEAKLVEWAVHMSEIGYGHTKEQLKDIVKQIIGCPNPFSDNRPGKKWWKLFKQRHPKISLRKPEHLQLARSKCFTSIVMQSWFTTFREFYCSISFTMNQKEFGMPMRLVFPYVQVLALQSSKCVYDITGDAK